MPSEILPFENVVGQTRPKNILQGALRRDTLARSYLFFGPPGCGKLALALELARAVNCLGDEPRPCRRCSPCRRIGAMQYPDVMVLFPRPKKIEEADLHRSLKILAENPYADLAFADRAEIHIDTVREIRTEAGLRPYEGRRKVFILAAADRMNLAAANALLKTLEEPPAHVLFIIVSDHPGRLPSTVISRCQQIRFTPLSQLEVAMGLEKMSLGDAQGRALASHLAQGDLRRAMELLNEDIQTERDEIYTALSSVMEKDFLAAIQWGQKVGKGKNRTQTRRYLESLQAWYRDLMFLLEGNENSLINADMIPRLTSVSRQYTWQGVQGCLQDIRESFRAVEANVNLELVWIVLLSRLKRRRKTGEPVHR